MIEQGHDVTLFSYDAIHNVPEGVRECDARQITGDRLDLFFRRAGQGRAIECFSDIFRYKMISQTELMWVDSDVFCLRPLHDSGGYLFSYVDEGHISNAVLALPSDSLALRDIINFCDDEFAPPPFYKRSKRIKLWAKKMMGNPVHISQLTYNVAGPEALTYYLRKTQEHVHASPTKMLYPIHFNDLHVFFFPSDLAHEQYLRGADCVHLFGSALRKIISVEKKIPAGCLVSELLKQGD